MFLEVKRTEEDKKDTLINSVSNALNIDYNIVFNVMSEKGWSPRAYKVKWDVLLKRTIEHFGYKMVKISYPVSKNMTPDKLDEDKKFIIKQSKDFCAVVNGKLLNHKNTDRKVIHLSFELEKA